MKTLNTRVPFERGFLGEEELQMDLPNVGIGLSGVLDLVVLVELLHVFALREQYHSRRPHSRTAPSREYQQSLNGESDNGPGTYNPR